MSGKSCGGNCLCDVYDGVSFEAHSKLRSLYERFSGVLEREPVEIFSQDLKVFSTAAHWYHEATGAEAERTPVDSELDIAERIIIRGLIWNTSPEDQARLDRVVALVRSLDTIEHRNELTSLVSERFGDRDWPRISLKDYLISRLSVYNDRLPPGQAAQNQLEFAVKLRSKLSEQEFESLYHDQRVKLDSLVKIANDRV